nr:PREDICTED: uncharacterized protein LOC108951719 isoform X1 [Musa acuminata subsp. malaccensis]
MGIRSHFLLSDVFIFLIPSGPSMTQSHRHFTGCCDPDLSGCAGMRERDAESLEDGEGDGDEGSTSFWQWTTDGGVAHMRALDAIIHLDLISDLDAEAIKTGTWSEQDFGGGSSLIMR